MLMPMEQGAREDWQRLASYVISARIAAGFATRSDLEVATGISARTLGKLETGHRVSPETLAAVAKVLGWTPDSPALILAGREQVTAGSSLTVPPPARPAIKFAPDPDDDEASALFPDDLTLRTLWRLDEPKDVRLALVQNVRRKRSETREGGGESLERGTA